MCYEDLAGADLIVVSDARKHGLTDEQIEHAWRNAIDYRRTDLGGGRFVVAALGFDRDGRALEMTAFAKPYGLVIYHANTPPTPRALREFGIG